MRFSEFHPQRILCFTGSYALKCEITDVIELTDELPEAKEAEQ